MFGMFYLCSKLLLHFQQQKMLAENRLKLENLGWHVIDLWECSIMRENMLIEILKKLYFRMGILEWYGKISDQEKVNYAV
jgi:G:T-mismatch repair DNA endonuclease (very short patch repair protein)